jgi:hypothetical protein
LHKTESYDAKENGSEQTREHFGTASGHVVLGDMLVDSKKEQLNGLVKTFKIKKFLRKISRLN